jgi:Zn-dependent peptidase ImmA (M78 family)
MDVMRTLAHELVHWKQMMDGDELDGSDGSSTENEANAIAGLIMRKFAKMYPDYFMDSMP